MDSIKTTTQMLQIWKTSVAFTVKNGQMITFLPSKFIVYMTSCTQLQTKQMGRQHRFKIQLI